jgi:hypothetical protein
VLLESAAQFLLGALLLSCVPQGKENDLYLHGKATRQYL